MFVEYNPNPVGNNVGDCVIRAITKAMDKSWEDTYIDIVVQGFLHSDMPSSNHVWDAYLRDRTEGVLLHRCGREHFHHRRNNTCTCR